MDEADLGEKTNQNKNDDSSKNCFINYRLSDVT